MTEPVEPPRQACGVCAKVLNVRTYDDGRVEYVHTEQDSPADHIAVPVDPDVIDTEGRCDFCNEDWPKFVLPVSDFVAMHGVMTGSDWAACEKCAALIEANQWGALHRRALAFYAARHGEEVPKEVGDHLKLLYGRVRKHIKGSMRPI